MSLSFQSINNALLIEKYESELFVGVPSGRPLKDIEKAALLDAFLSESANRELAIWKGAKANAGKVLNPEEETKLKETLLDRKIRGTKRFVSVSEEDLAVLLVPKS